MVYGAGQSLVWENAMKVVARAIEGCLDSWEELAFAFCEAVAPEARKIVTKFELVNQLRTLRSKSDAVAIVAQSARNMLESAQEAEKGAQAAPKRGKRFFVGVCAFLSLVWLPSVAPGGILWMGLIIAGIAVCSILGLKARSARAAVIAAAGADRLAAEVKFNEVRLEHEALVQQAADLKAEYEGIKLAVPVAALGRLALPVRTATLAGYQIVLDEAAVFAEYRFELPDYVYDRNALDTLGVVIEQLRNPPVLLEPGEGEHGDIDLLHGEEESLRRCVEGFAEFVGSIPTISRQTPLVPRSAAAASLPAAAALPGERSPLCTVNASNFQARFQEIASIGSHAKDLRERASHARAEITATYEALRQLLADYQTLRSTSISELHDNLIASMERSSWSHVRFYCPKSMRVPEYIFETTGIDVNHVEDLSTRELMNAMFAHEETALRLARDESLGRRIEDAKSALDEIRYALSRAIAAAMPGEMTSPLGNSQITIGPAAASIATHLQSQLRESTKQFRQVVLEAVTGASRPLLEIASQSRLRYDPLRNSWASEVAGTEYVDQAHVDFGRLLRLHEEVLFPIWNHLWLEKADFRRSELFRTNEQLLRMKEKESEKLIVIGNQFRADLRMVREQLKTLSNDLDSKVEQIRATRDGLASLGLLGEEDLQRMSDAVLDGLKQGCGGSLEHASAMETLLSLEPTAQADRRPNAADPIDVVRSPDRLFRESLPESMRRQLADRAISMGRASAAAGETLAIGASLGFSAASPIELRGGDA